MIIYYLDVIMWQSAEIPVGLAEFHIQGEGRG